MANTTDYSRLLDGYALLAIKDYIKNNYLSLSGGKLTGSLEIKSTGSSWSEGIRIHPSSNNWGGIVLCEASNSGSTGTSAKTWSMHNNEGVFGFYQNGSNIGSVTAGLSYNGSQWIMKNGNSNQILFPTAAGTIALVGNNSHTHTKSQITDFPTSMPASDVYAWAKAATKPSYTYGEITSGVVSNALIDVHPESAASTISYYTNDLVNLLARGGTCTATNKTRSTTVSTSITNWFDGTPTYGGFTVTAVTDVVEILISLPSGTSYSWGTHYGIGFGNSGWRAKDVKIETGYESGGSTVWRTVYNVTNSSQALHDSGSQGGPGTASGNPWNRIRITLTNFNNTSPRIAQIWTQNYGSKGLAYNFVQTGGSTMYGTLNMQHAYPRTTNTYDLGSSSYQWNNAYIKTIYENGTALSSKYAAYSHTHSYAGSSSAGGAATSANKLNTNAGSATNPVYFSGGVPVACTYSLNKTVPADAVFTDTKYTAGTGLTLSSNQFSVSAANVSTMLNLLSTGSSTPVDADYYISQYVGGGTTTTTYHRRPMSALWAYIKGKADSTYLGKTAKAADSSKLDGHALSYFITTDNIASQYVYHSDTSDWATDADNSNKLNGNGPAYYLNYNNFTNTPSSVLYTSQTLTDAQKTQARSNIGAGTSSFTGYTSSNKLHTDYINNAAGWTSVTESTVSGWGFTKNAGTVTQVKVGTTAYNPSSGIVSLPAYPTKSSWNYDDVYIKLTGNQSIAGNKSFTGKIIVTDNQNSYEFIPGQAGDVSLILVDEQDNKTYVYLMNPNTPNTVQYIALRSWVSDNYLGKTAKAADSSKLNGQAASYYLNYNNFTNTPSAVLYSAQSLTDAQKTQARSNIGAGTSSLAIGTTASTAAAGNHTHTLSIASGGTSSINLQANTTYTLTAGGKTYAFKTPASGGYYSNQYNEAYYLSSNSAASLWSEDIQAGMAAIGLGGGNATVIGIGWPGLASGSFKRSLLFTGNRVDLTLIDRDQNYLKGLSIDMYDDDYYTLHIRANEYSDLYGSVDTENYAHVNLHAYSFVYTPYSTNSAVSYRKYVDLGVVMHNINYTYSSTVLLKMNIRGTGANDSAITSYAGLCGLLYNAGHRSAATCLTCSGRYSSSTYVVLGVYATGSTSGLYLVYCSASSNTVNTLSIPSGTVTDTLSASLVP